MASESQAEKRVLVFAAHVPEPEKLKRMLEIKDLCEKSDVSLPKEVADFFTEFPQHKPDQFPCSHGEHMFIFKKVTWTLSSVGNTPTVEVRISCEELECTKNLKHNCFIVIVPQSVFDTSQSSQ